MYTCIKINAGFIIEFQIFCPVIAACIIAVVAACVIAVITCVIAVVTCVITIAAYLITNIATVCELLLHVWLLMPVLLYNYCTSGYECMTVLVITPTTQAKHVGSSVHYPSISYRIYIGGSGIAKGGRPRPSQMPAVPCHLGCKRLRY